MLTKKRTIVTKKTSSGSVAYMHPTLPSPILSAHPEFVERYRSVLNSMKNFMLPGIRFPSDGRIDLERMSESLCLNDNRVGYVRGRWVERMADRYGEHAEQLQIITT